MWLGLRMRQHLRTESKCSMRAASGSKSIRKILFVSSKIYGFRSFWIALFK